jgi:hypothetical protein
VAFDKSAAALEEVKVQRIDHTMDELVDQLSTLAEPEVEMHANLARAKHERNQCIYARAFAAVKINLLSGGDFAPETDSMASFFGAVHTRRSDSNDKRRLT